MQKNNKQLFYEHFAATFDAVVNRYDTEKRLQVFFDELLPTDLHGKKLLDAGCGTGWFSARAVQQGAQVTSLDVGKKLLQEVAKKCSSTLVVGDVLNLPFTANTFDVVVSSEVIEHTTNPLKALKEFYRVLKPGGLLVVSTPNARWYWALQIAQFLRLRPYQGYEHWLSHEQLKHGLLQAGFRIRALHGIHAFPFVLPILNPLLDYLHQFRYVGGPYMVNLVAKCQK